jgi:hypothetical protein
MSELKNCINCHTSFVSVTESKICLKCLKEDDIIFKKIKDFLYDNPGATMLEVSSTFDISTKKIIKFLRDGRLEIIGDSNFILECESCGRPIKTEYLCNDCQRILKNEFLRIGSKIRAKFELDSTGEVINIKYHTKNRGVSG